MNTLTLGTSKLKKSEPKEKAPRESVQGELRASQTSNKNTSGGGKGNACSYRDEDKAHGGWSGISQRQMIHT